MLSRIRDYNGAPLALFVVDHVMPCVLANPILPLFLVGKGAGVRELAVFSAAALLAVEAEAQPLDLGRLCRPVVPVVSAAAAVVVSTVHRARVGSVRRPSVGFHRDETVQPINT